MKIAASTTIFGQTLLENTSQWTSRMMVRTQSGKLIADLYQIRSYFYTGDFESVVKEPIDNVTRSDEAQLYKYRARIELGDAATVASEMSEVGSTGGGFEAVKAYAEYRSGSKQKAVEDMMELIEADSEDNTVQVVGAAVLYSEGRVEEALDLLSKHESNLEAYACFRRADG
jgi:hypothetical protein